MTSQDGQQLEDYLKLEESFRYVTTAGTTLAPVVVLRCRRRNHAMARIYATPMGLLWLPAGAFRASKGHTQAVLAAANPVWVNRAHGRQAADVVNTEVITPRRLLEGASLSGRTLITFGCQCTSATESIDCFRSLARHSLDTRIAVIRFPRAA